MERIEGLMTEIQENIYRKALNYRESMITKVDTWEEFKQVLDDKGGFLLAHWDGTVETRWRSRRPRRPRSAAFRSTRSTRRAYASSPASRRTAACCSPAAISLRRARCRAIIWNIPGEYPPGIFGPLCRVVPAVRGALRDGGSRPEKRSPVLCFRKFHYFCSLS